MLTATLRNHPNFAVVLHTPPWASSRVMWFKRKTPTTDRAIQSLSVSLGRRDHAPCAVAVHTLSPESGTPHLHVCLAMREQPGHGHGRGSHRLPQEGARRKAGRAGPSGVPLLRSSSNQASRPLRNRVCLDFTFFLLQSSLSPARPGTT